jgi:hypothetical protein
MRQAHCACEMPYQCQLCNFRSSMYTDAVDHFKKVCLFLWYQLNSTQLNFIGFNMHSKESVKITSRSFLKLFTKNPIVKGADKHSPNASRIQDWRVKVQTHSPVWQAFFPLSLTIFLYSTCCFLTWLVQILDYLLIW